MDAEEFGQVVDGVLASLSPDLLDHMDNVVIRVEDEHPNEDLLGLYEGVALPDRHDYSGFLPDSITLYRIPLLTEVRDVDELAAEIRTTLIHEIGHHFGLTEHRLHELGWG
jgi:predicted Zn-dependent protease with MMP-like domain